MAGGRESPWRDMPSIKYRRGSLRRVSLEMVDFGLEDYVSAPTANKQRSRTPEPRDSHICSTGELISALGFIWDSVTGPLSILVPKSTCRYESRSLQECNNFWYFSEDGKRYVHIAADNQNQPFNLTTVGDSLPTVGGYLGFLSVESKISFIQPSSGINSLLRGLLHGSDLMIEDPLKERSSSNKGLECYLHKAYGWMTERDLHYQERMLKFRGMEKHDDDDDSSIRHNISDPAKCRISVYENSSSNNLSIENEDCHSENTKLGGLSLGQNDFPNSSMKASAATLCTGHRSVQDMETCSSKIPNSSLCADSLGIHVPSKACISDESECSVKPNLDYNKINHQQDFSVEKDSKVEVCFPVKEKHNRVLAKQEHAFAGAMAGIFVSLSLHPVDTIKTVVQSCRGDQKSLHDVCRSIISQRGCLPGITGLYRGFSTNIASSAPISAVYTFTYESIKGNLLPFLPMGYQSVAHCMAGGCASVATSFIFTPSERIKQQMQVGSRYQNSWNAFMGIIEKGGLPSLYAGWGAVLCRNVPHSVIKFYTYESLKRLLSSVQLDGQTNTFVTLISGGLAASAAALFSTPFDVVKTRVQTQNPASLNQYPSVFDTLKEIAKNEGIKCLYRGLTPRLLMYMTQGGLFFASYESFKRLFSLDGSDIKVQANALEKTEDDLHEDEGNIM